MPRPVSSEEEVPQQEKEEQAGSEDLEEPHVPQRGEEGHRAQLPVVAEDGGTEQTDGVEDPEVAVGESPVRYIVVSEVS